MPKSTKPWRIFVSYPAKLFPDLDDKIEKAAGVSADGAGMGFGERDMDFTVKTEGEANAAVARIKKVNSKINATCQPED